MSINEVAGLLEPKEIKGLLEKKCKTQTTAVDASCKLMLILDRIELSFPSIFAPKRGADFRVEKSELCTPFGEEVQDPDYHRRRFL
jgi:hypothetical protein